MLLRDCSIGRVIHCCAAIAIALTYGNAAVAWEFAHGDRDNSGFANVDDGARGQGLGHGAGPRHIPLPARVR